MLNKYVRIEDDGNAANIKEDSPELALHCAIVNQAIRDAKHKNYTRLTHSAFNYLFTSLSDKHLTLIDIDPVVFREALVKQMGMNARGVTSSVMKENKGRRAFMRNYETYKQVVKNPSKILDLPTDPEDEMDDIEGAV